MSWATPHIEKLQKGETVQFRPRGNSMEPKIKSGQLVTVAPIGDHVVRKGDIVLCKVKGKHYLHLVEAVSFKLDDAKKGLGGRFQIGNNKKRTNGTIGRQSIYGILIKVED